MAINSGVPLTGLPGMKDSLTRIVNQQATIENNASCFYSDVENAIELGASLALFSNAYKEDVVFPLLPTDGSGDLTFTRASTATRVNSDGLIETSPVNLVLYSEEFDNGYWQKGRISVTANTQTSPIGTTTADTIIDTAESGTHRIFTSSISVTSGIDYATSCFVKSGTSNRIEIRLLSSIEGNIGIAATVFDLSTGTIVSGSGSIENFGGGWFRCTNLGTSNTTGNASAFIYLYNSANERSYLGTTTNTIFTWGAQLNIGATAKPYFPTTDRLNVPRIDYTGGGCGSLLLEKQSTNLVTYSEQFDNAAWTKSNTTVTGNTATSPDGTQNADTITSSAASPQLISPAVSFASSTNVSLFVKYVSQKYVQLFSGGAFGDYVNFDIESGAVGSNGGTTTNAQIQNFGNGWFRISATFGGYTGTTTGRIGFADSLSAGWNALSSTTSKSVYGWGFQIEQSSYPTSYIPNLASSVTRLADAASKTGISSLIGASEGTFFVDAEINFNADGTILASLLNTAGAFTNAVYWYITGSKLEAAIWVTPQFTGWTQSTSTLTNGRHKVALSWKANDYAFYLNGTQVGVSNSYSAVPSGMSKIDLANYVSSYQSDQKFNEAILFPTRLTNAQLAELTTL